MRGIQERLVSILAYIGGLTSLGYQATVLSVTPPLKLSRFFNQAKRIGLDSLPIVSIVALFTGMILAFQTTYLLKKLSSEIYIANLVALSLVRELGPVFTALVVAGRVGASITAEMGTMTVTEQVDALQTLAANPVKYLVVPRFLGMVIMLPLLVIYTDLIGILGGFTICVYKLGVTGSMYMAMTFQSLVLKDLFSGLMKSLVFGIIIALVSCYEGLRTSGGAEGVGRSTTLSVVTSFILIITADCVFTALFYFVF
jgi:phospholipid/cholesterol/gamma-HCH transport system permease protein